jgi:hypothetical protein
MKMILFHFERGGKGNGPETAEANMKGLAPSRPNSKAAGSEKAGRRRCLSFPANVRKIKTGKRGLTPLIF